MTRFERTLDMDVVRNILTHPRIYPHISDDHSPPVDEYDPPRHDSIWYVLAFDEDAGDELLGLWMFVPQNSVCWEVHTALLPLAWGERGHAAARVLPDWIFAKTSCRRIVTNVPSTNRLALRFAISAGMKIYGVNRESFLKDGILCDQVCLGISPFLEEPVEEAEAAKEETCQQQ